MVRGYSEINRLDQQRSITITADLDASEANSQQIADALRNDYFDEDFEKKYPAVSVNWEGQQQQTYESLTSLGIGSALASSLSCTFCWSSNFVPTSSRC